MSQISLELCRECPLYLNETENNVSCKRIKDLITYPEIMPYFENETNKIIKTVHCKWGSHAYYNYDRRMPKLPDA